MSQTETLIKPIQSRYVPVRVSELTAREMEVITWAARGKTRDETAGCLGISGRTVQEYLENARYKLNATNTAHAITIAIHYGLIVP